MVTKRQRKLRAEEEHLPAGTSSSLPDQASAAVFATPSARTTQPLLIPSPINATTLVAGVTPSLRIAAWVFPSPVLYLYPVNESKIPR